MLLSLSLSLSLSLPPSITHRHYAPFSMPYSAALFVMATTTTRVFQFVGGASLAELFAKYEEGTPPGFHELPGDLRHSELKFFARPGSQTPNSFAWLTGPGVFHGSLRYGSAQQAAEDPVMTDTLLLPYPDPREAPRSIVLTEFHIMLLYGQRFQAVNRLSEELVYAEVRAPRPAVRESCA